MKSRGLLIWSIVLIVIALIGLAIVNFYTFTPRRDGGLPLGPYLGPDGDFESNGQQIFLTGVSRRGVVRISGGPIWFQMHGGGCATCHGPDGRGGTVTMMGRLEAPDITYENLTSESEAEEHGGVRYTDALIKRAVTRGIDAGGDRLNSNMPRWRMSDADFDDLLDYMKTDLNR